MANKEQFKVIEAKSTVQKLVDYNSNTLLPYTILDAITEYTESNKTAAFGIDLIFKKILGEIDKNDISLNSSGSTNRYYPVFYDSNALNESNYKGGLVKGKTAFSYRDPGAATEELKFLTQNGDFESAPVYQFVTDCSAGMSSTQKAFASSVTSDYSNNTKTVTLTFSYDGVHFTNDYSNALGQHHMFGPSGSFKNFLDAIDGVTYHDGEGTDQDQTTNNNTGNSGVRPASEYVSIFYKNTNSSDINTLTTAVSIADLRVGHAFNLRATTHANYIRYGATDTTNDSSIDGSVSGSKSYIVVQRGEDATKFLKIPITSEVLAGGGSSNEHNGNICLVTDNNGVLKWGSAGINLVKLDNSDDTIHYLIGKTTSDHEHTNSTVRNDQLVYSTKTYFKNGSIFQSSDERLKAFEYFNISLRDIASIKVAKFRWVNSDNSDIVHFGVSAQSVEKVLPEIVSTAADGYKSVEYDKLGALSIYGIKLLTDEIDELKQRIEKLEEKLK